VKNKNKGGFLFLFFILLLAGFFGLGKEVFAESAYNGLLIAEIMYNPEGSNTLHSKWVELKNMSDNEIVLTPTGSKTTSGYRIRDLKITDSSNHYLYFSDNKPLVISSGGYFVIAENVENFKNDYPELEDLFVLKSAIALTSAKDPFNLDLYDNTSLLGSASYFKSWGADDNGKTLEKIDLTKGNSQENWQESYVSGGTPGEKNSEKPKPKVYSDKIILSELLPAPSFGNEEFIELYNPTMEAVDISGYSLKDTSKTGKYVFPEGAEIKSLDYLVAYKKDFKFALNNSGTESVSLFDPNEKIISVVSYSGSKTDVSYNFNGDTWHWSKFLTPEAENKFNNLPEVSKKKDNKIYANIYADFSAKGYDADKDKLKFTWDFGDGHKSYLKKTKHKFKKAGSYKVTLKVSDESEDKIETFNIKVEKFPKNKVKIVSVSPNPTGKDSDSEFITLQNNSKKKINLKNWSVATGSKNLYNHPISEDVFIKPGGTLKLARDLSKFALNNKKAKVELRYPNGKVASRLAYNKKTESVAEDEVYTKESGQWVWVAPKAETKLAVAEKPASVEAKPRLIEVAEIEEPPKEILAESSGIVAGVSEEKTELVMPQKISYKTILFNFLNSRINYLLNKFSFFLD
jgi:hypothetical protein